MFSFSFYPTFMRKKDKLHILNHTINCEMTEKARNMQVNNSNMRVNNSIRAKQTHLLGNIFYVYQSKKSRLVFRSQHSMMLL